MCAACPYLVKVWTAENSLTSNWSDSHGSFRYVSPGYHTSPIFYCEHPSRHYPLVLLHGEYFPKSPAPADCPLRNEWGYLQGVTF